jgi:hypothetical protein
MDKGKENKIGLAILGVLALLWIIGSQSGGDGGGRSSTPAARSEPKGLTEVNASMAACLDKDKLFQFETAC